MSKKATDTHTADPRGELQGEGNYDATRRYDQAVRRHVRSGQVEPAARAAQPRTPKEADEMKRAEEIGRSHSKGEDADEVGGGG